MRIAMKITRKLKQKKEKGRGEKWKKRGKKNFVVKKKTPSISFCKNNGLRMRGVKVSHFYKIKFRFITKIQLINLKIIQIIQRKRTQNKTQKYHKQAKKSYNKINI